MSSGIPADELRFKEREILGKSDSLSFFLSCWLFEMEVITEL
jgi:hypothetical protein